MKYKHLVSCVFAISIGILYSQQNKNDTFTERLTKVDLSATKNDTNKVNAFNNLSQQHCQTGNYDSAFFYADSARKLAEELNYKIGIVYSHSNIGNIYTYKGDYDKALGNYFASLKISEEIGDNKSIAHSYGNIGNIYYTKGDYDKALKNYFTSLKISEEVKDKPGTAICYSNIALIYCDRGNYDEALEKYFASLKIREETGDKNGIASSYANIGLIYSNQGNYDKALEYYFASLKISEEIGSKYGVAVNYNSIGMAYLEQKKTDEAKKISLKSLSLAMEIGSKELIENAYKTLSRCDSVMGNWKSAYKYHQLYSQYKDSLLNEESSRQIARMQAMYESEKKDKEIETLTQHAEIMSLQNIRSRYVIYGLTGSILLLFIIAVLMLMQHKQKARLIAVELEQKLLRSQMNPHFIFNSLNAIQSFIYKNEIKESAKYLSGFAKLMRMILENSREEYISLEKEMNTLQYYLNLQKLRFENKFDFTLEVAPQIDVKNTGIPPMFAQPFIENALEHGIKHKDSKGKIEVHFKLDNDMLVLEVYDNGIGRKKSEQIRNSGNTHRSISTTITQERIAALNKKNKKKIQWNIIDIDTGEMCGTKVIFTIPYKKLIADSISLESV